MMHTTYAMICGSSIFINWRITSAFVCTSSNRRDYRLWKT